MPILRHFFLVDFLVPRNYTETMTARLQLLKILCKSSLDALEKEVASVTLNQTQKEGT